MSQHGRYRTFVQLDAYERWILRMIQRGVMDAHDKKKPLPMNKIISMVIRDYWSQYEENADPELLEELKRKVPIPRARPMTMSLDEP